jgi:hypothetical protein
MKYKVLLLLLFIALACSRVLKRSKTKQDDTYTLDVKLPDEYSANRPYYVFCTTDDFFAKHNKDFNELANHSLQVMKHNGMIKVLADLLICIYNLKNDEKITIPISELKSPMSYDQDDGIWQIKIEDKTFYVHSHFNDAALDIPSEMLALMDYFTGRLYFHLKWPTVKIKEQQITSDSSLYYNIINKYHDIILNNEKENKNIFYNLQVMLFDKVNNLAKNTNVSDMFVLMRKTMLNYIIENNVDINILLIFMSQVKKHYEIQQDEQRKRDRESLRERVKQIQRDQQIPLVQQYLPTQEIQLQRIDKTQLDQVSRALDNILKNLPTLGLGLINYLQQAIVNPNFRLLFDTLDSYEEFLFFQKLFKLDPVQQAELLQVMNSDGQPNKEIKDQYKQVSDKIKDFFSMEIFVQKYNILLQLLTSLLEEHNKKKVYYQEQSKLEVMNSLFSDINLNDLTFEKFEILLRYKRDKSRILNIDVLAPEQIQLIKNVLIEWGQPSLAEISRLMTFLELNKMDDLIKMKLFLSKDFTGKNEEFISKYSRLTLNEASLINSVFKRGDIKKIQGYIDYLSVTKQEPNKSTEMNLKRQVAYLVEKYVKPKMSKRIPK